MRKRQTGFWLLAVIAIILLASCDILFGTRDDKEKDTDTPAAVLEKGQFYAQNLTNNKYYVINAEKLYDGTLCEIWAEKGSGVTAGTAQTIANEYDKKIYNIVVNAFSMKNFNFSYLDNYSGRQLTERFDNIMKFADWLTEGNGKLTILLLDIKDGYKKEGDAYTAGYFFGGDFYGPGPITDNRGNILYYSNGKVMMYIDTKPGVPGSPESNATFAHELQHLISFATSIALGRKSLMDTWIDEGLSSQAEYLYLGKHPEDRVKWFNADPAETIRKGNNFYIWGNHTDVPNAILDEYATAYLFFQWLYLQKNKDANLFLNITSGNYTNYQAVTDVAKTLNPAWSDWGALLSTWMAANYAPDNAAYGYRGAGELQQGTNKITVKTISTTTKTITLDPGEGVYSSVSGSNNSVPASGSGSNIKYAGLSAGAAPVSVTSGAVTGTALLTYNVNTAQTSSSETGHLTGAPPAVSSTGSNERSLAGNGFSGPLLIDARDILGRDKFELPSIPLRRP